MDRQSKRPSPTQGAVSTHKRFVYRNHLILVKHGLIEKTLSIPDAYKVFLKAGSDPEVQKLRRTVERGNKMKRSRFVSSHSDGSARHDEAGA